MRNNSKIRILLALLCALLMLAPPSVGAADLDTTGFENAGIILYECSTQTTLYANVSANIKFHPGSITKLLTGLTLLDYYSLDEQITVEAAMLDLVEYNSSTSGLIEGEVLTIEQLLSAMLIPSGNDASKVAAVGGGRRILGTDATIDAAYTAFIAKMNEKAAALGMSQSHFANSDGYDNPDNYATPADTLKLAVAASQNEAIAAVCARKSTTVTTNRKTHYWYSTNLLLYKSFSGLVGYTGSLSGTNKFYDSRVNGLKTGNTDDGGRCFALRADDGEMQIIGIFLGMGTSADAMWRFIGKCADYCFDNYRMLDLINEDMREYTYKIKNGGIGSEDTLLLEAAVDECRVVYGEHDREKITYVMVPNPDVATLFDTDVLRLRKSVKAGDIVAYCVALDTAQNNAELSRIPFAAVVKYRKANLLDYLARGLMVLGVVAILGYIALFILQNNGTIKKKNGRKTA